MDSLNTPHEVVVARNTLSLFSHWGKGHNWVSLPNAWLTALLSQRRCCKTRFCSISFLYLIKDWNDRIERERNKVRDQSWRPKIPPLFSFVKTQLVLFYNAKAACFDQSLSRKHEGTKNPSCWVTQQKGSAWNETRTRTAVMAKGF